MSVDGKREIDELRNEMARLDAQVLACLEKRAAAAKQVAELRKEQPTTDAVVDKAALAALVQKGAGDMPPHAVREIFREIFATCLSLEMPVPVAFVGTDGCLSHLAARNRFGVAGKFVAAETAVSALGMLSQKLAHFAVVPYETREDGPVHASVMALVASDAKINDSFEIASNLQVMNRSGQQSDIEKICGTAGDLSHCEHFLDSLGSRVQVLDVKSAVVAAELAAADPKMAAVVREPFGVELDLSVACRNVRDGGDERVRYAVVGPRPPARTGRDMTALVFSVNDSPGALHTVLKQFAERGINMTKIQSRPATGEAWDYVFFVEIVGHATDRPVVAALEEVKRQTKFVKVLGSYGIG